MIEFSVNLSERDIKNFIKFKLGFQNFSFFLKIVAGVFFLGLVIVLNLIFGFGLIAWFAIYFLTLFFLCFVYKKYLAFRKMLAKCLHISGKERRFFIDGRFLNIICYDDEALCGRYSFYDLTQFDITSEYMFLTFSSNIFIIIPKRYLDELQFLEVCKILKKSR